MCINIDVDSYESEATHTICATYFRGEKYYIENNGLRAYPSGRESLISYNPLSEKSLLRDFMGVEDEAAIIKFSDKYGDLGLAHGYYDDHPNELACSANEIEMILFHAKTMRACNQAISIFKLNCMDSSLSDSDKKNAPILDCNQRLFINNSAYDNSYRQQGVSLPMISNEECYDCPTARDLEMILMEFFTEKTYRELSAGQPYLACDSVPEYTVPRSRESETNVAYRFPFLKNYFFLIRPYYADINSCTKILNFIQECISQNLSLLKLQCLWDNSGKLALMLKGNLLIEYLWYAFANSYSLPHIQCQTCGKWFISSHHDSKFCPPVFGRKYSKCHPSYIAKLKHHDTD